MLQYSYQQIDTETFPKADQNLNCSTNTQNSKKDYISHQSIQNKET